MMIKFTLSQTGLPTVFSNCSITLADISLFMFLCLMLISFKVTILNNILNCTSDKEFHSTKLVLPNKAVLIVKRVNAV
jgi:hypothetical protein